MPRYRSRSRGRSWSRSPVRRKRYDNPLERRRDRHSPAPSGLLVRNISLNARPDDLRIPFERFGPIKDIYLPKNYYTGEPRGFGFVKFRYPEDAAEAKSHLNRTVIGGCEIRIVFAEENRKTPHEMRRISHVSSRRRSRSRSPRNCYHYSRSPSPAQHDSRSALGYEARDRYSPRCLRSVTRSVSPRDDRSHRSHQRSPKHSRSLSCSVSPGVEKNVGLTSRSPSPVENGKRAPAEDFMPSLRRRPRSPTRSQSRSYSLRRRPRSPTRSQSRSYSPS